MFFDPNYLLLMAPAFILMMATTVYVNSSYRKWGRVRARSGMTGYQATQRLIASAGLYGIRIEGIRGNLTDHYDPRQKVLRLSQGVAESPSVASLAIAAHELGHAMQDSEGYFPLRVRAALVPMVNIGSYLGWILIMLGLFLRLTDLAWLGVLAFAGGAVFALATLPVEFNASKRARELLVESGIINSDDEMGGVSHVLNAAALTYVAALVTAVLQILYYATMLIGLGGRSRD